MFGFLRKHQIIFLAIILIIIALQELSINTKKEGEYGFSSKFTLNLFYYPQKIITIIVDGIGYIWGDYIFLVNLKKENDLLKNEISELKRENTQLKEALIENQRLRDLLEFKTNLSISTKAARIIGEDSSNWSKSILIDKGSSSRISRGMAVISKDGIVGRVQNVSKNSSKVLLLLDRNFRIDSLVDRTRVKGIVEGNMNGFCRMKYITNINEVEVGDKIISSGLSRIFPKGIDIGTIYKIDSDNSELFLNILVKPSVDFLRLEDVLVVTDLDKRF